MSVSNGFFTSADGEVVRMSAVVAVDPMQGNNGGSFYEVIITGGSHFTVKEAYFSRADFITAWMIT